MCISLPADVQLWSGGHDAKVCAVDDRCSVMYQVGTLKDNGEIAQAGGTKAIIRAGWNVWVFGMKGISIYSPHCVIDPLTRQVPISLQYTVVRVAVDTCQTTIML